jgi:hypothetical protein
MRNLIQDAPLGTGSTAAGLFGTVGRNVPVLLAWRRFPVATNAISCSDGLRVHVEESLLAMGRIGKAVLENREDISELERVIRDTRQACREAVGNYESHRATHTAKYRTDGAAGVI